MHCRSGLTLGLSFVLGSAAPAVPPLAEPPDFSNSRPGPSATYAGSPCFQVASGSIVPGDVDWVRITIPLASSKTVIDVDFADSTAASALLVQVVGGNTGFSQNDNNNTNDTLCGLGAGSTPIGSRGDSVVDIRATARNAVLDIAVTGLEDAGFVGNHSRTFNFDLWVYTVPIPCTADADCVDAVACTIDHCDLATGVCSSAPDDTACDDALFCNGAETCSTSAGCRPGTPPSCDDALDCTIDACDAQLDSCTSAAVHARCSDGVFCNGTEQCNVQLGCVAGSLPDCSDDVACTGDSCDLVSDACAHTPDDSLCDDGVYCTGVERCQVATGCLSGTPPTCPDTVECTVDACDSISDSCTHTPTDARCDDGQFCNGRETCDETLGCRLGPPPFCGDRASCTKDSCDEINDRCIHLPDNAACSDGRFCNGDETCNPLLGCAPGRSRARDFSAGKPTIAASNAWLTQIATTPTPATGTRNAALTVRARAAPPPCGPGQTCDPNTGQCLGEARLRLDLKPGACPNALPRNGQGYVKPSHAHRRARRPIHQRGFDPPSTRDGVGGSVAPNAGPPGPKSTITDVATPFTGEPCACHALAGDGRSDLVVSFSVAALVSGLQLAPLAQNSEVELEVGGLMSDGAAFVAYDCAKLIGPSRSKTDESLGEQTAIETSDAEPQPVDTSGSQINVCGVRAVNFFLLIVGLFAIPRGSRCPA